MRFARRLQAQLHRGNQQRRSVGDQAQRTELFDDEDLQ